MSKATETALDGLPWLSGAIRALHDAAANLAEVSREVARDIEREDERFLGARVNVDTAWDQVTGKALPAIAEIRAALRFAEREGREAAAAQQGGEDG